MKTMSVKKSLILLTILAATAASPSKHSSNELKDSDETFEYLVDTAETKADDCRRGCPRILDPVCAVDGSNIKYFHNQCLMEFDSCRRERAWKPTQMLQCITYVDPVIRDDCLRACPFIYDPVCASIPNDMAELDYFEIFGNRCIFGMENCLASGKWFEVRGEECGL